MEPQRFWTFDLTFSTATITARGALIYLANGGTNPAVAVLDFGSDKTSTAGDFTIVFPAADASNAIIRLPDKCLMLLLSSKDGEEPVGAI